MPVLKKPVFWLLVLPIAALLIWLLLLPDQHAASLAPVDPATYRADLQKERADKDKFMQTSADSPIPDKAAFKGLTYFEADPGFRVVAKLDPFAGAQPEKLVIQLTDGSEDVYEKYAHAQFTLAGQACRVLVLRHDKTLTILFRDETSGKETYGGGRYLDLDDKTVSDKQVVLDFNAAYNPYCAYNPNYACPLPSTLR